MCAQTVLRSLPCRNYHLNMQITVSENSMKCIGCCQHTRYSYSGYQVMIQPRLRFLLLFFGPSDVVSRGGRIPLETQSSAKCAHKTVGTYWR